MKRVVSAVALAIAAGLSLIYIATYGRSAPGAGEIEGGEELAEAGGPLRLGWTAWADAEFVTRLAARVLRERMNVPVELVMADIGLQYEGVASGSLDAMLMAWLPATHEPYWTRVAGDVADLGPIYNGARLGWAVPASVPASQLSSITDLGDPAVAARVGGRVQGIDPGSGLMQASERALRIYELEEIELISASGAAMTAALERAIRRDEWIVITAWSPHWMFARWDLRYLDDPRGVLGGSESVHAVARADIGDRWPDVAAFLARMYIPLEELEAALLDAEQRSVGAAVDRYIAEHPARIDYWVTGEPAGDES